MMKRALSFLLVFVSVAVFCPTVSLAADEPSGFSHFTTENTYVTGQFKDVSSTAWYAENVKTAYELGLMVGSGGYFNANGNISIAETIVLACRLHSIYYADGAGFTQGNPWYQIYVNYALKNGILSSEYSSYTKTATRAEFAVILAAALPDEAFQSISSIDDGAIPDVSTSSSYASAVYKLYRAGVLTGNDSAGTFTPGSNIGRNAAAAIVTRIADPDLRKSITLAAQKTMTAKEIYAQCSPAVFCIKTYDVDGDAYALGSGFFIDASGIAVTNYHVIDNACKADIITSDGNTYSSIKVIGYDKDADVAFLKVDGSGFHTLSVGNSSEIQGGETVYAIGSPYGLTNTITEGIVSSPCRQDYNNMIQVSVPISSGSSGGALINEYGQVVGITTASLSAGENLNFAVPINTAMAVQRNKSLSLTEVAQQKTIADYKNAPEPFDYNIDESEPNDSIYEAEEIDNGTSVWGTIDDGNLDEFYTVCNTKGTIQILLFSDSGNRYIEDLMLTLGRMDASTVCKASLETLDDGSEALWLSYDIPKAGLYTINIFSKALYKTENLKTDYAFYYYFTPEGY